MAKFKFKLKLQGLEVEVEGDRTDVPLIANNIGQQFAGLLQPSANIVDGETPGASKSVDVEAAVSKAKPVQGTVSRRRRRRSTAGSEKGESPKAALEWRHDPAKWGSPQQGWNSATKALWLLYVVGEELGVAEVASRDIADTFNKHFKQSGLVRTHNVSRDLGKIKGGKDAYVGEDTTKDPSAWFLTAAGKKHAASLVAEAKGKKD